MTSARKNAVVCAVLSAVSALLLWSAYAPRHETMNLLVALTPLLVIARVARPKRAALWFFLGGFLFWFLTISWMPAIVKNNGPWPLVAMGWTGLAVWCSAYFALFGWLDARLWRRAGDRAVPRLLALFAEAALWAGCEWLRGTAFTGFGWNGLGLMAPDLLRSFALPARLGGVYLLGALVVLCSGTFASLLLRVFGPMWRLSFPKNRWSRPAETVLPLLAIWGVMELSVPDWRAHDRAGAAGVPVRVALVQRNAPCCFRAGMVREDPREAFGSLLDMVAAAKPDLVVLAESAFAEFGGDVARPRALDAAAWMLGKANAGALVAGGDWTDAGKTYNAAALFTTNAAPPQVYAKQHLVPFGEFIPLDKWITPLQRLSPVGVSLHPGEPKLLDLPVVREDGSSAIVKIAPLICFEDTDPTLACRAARMGAQMIVLITNDSWFSDSCEAEQHAAHTVLRACETGLPVVRVGNSGVTGFVTGLGRADWLMAADGRRPLVDARGWTTGTVLARPSAPTPYARFGDWPMLALFLAAVLVAVAPHRQSDGTVASSADPESAA